MYLHKEEKYNCLQQRKWNVRKQMWIGFWGEYFNNKMISECDQKSVASARDERKLNMIVKKNHFWSVRLYAEKIECP